MTADTSPLQQALARARDDLGRLTARPYRVRVDADTAEARSSIGRLFAGVGTRFNLGGGFARVGGVFSGTTAAVAGTTAAFAGVGVALYRAAEKAADLGESISKVKVTFGGASGDMLKQADDLADRFGVVKKETLDASAAFGLMGKAAGLSDDASAQLGKEFVQLGLDIASFHNLSNADAFQKLRSGLAGEVEPLRAIGILLSEDAVKAEAYRTGLAKAGAELTQQQKVLARASLIRTAAGPAVGDLERTADSAKNQLRKLQGEWENFQVRMGEALIPALTAAVGAANDLGAAFTKAFGTDPLKAFGDELQAIILGVRGLFSGIEGGGFTAGKFKTGLEILLQRSIVGEGGGGLSPEAEARIRKLRARMEEMFFPEIAKAATTPAAGSAAKQKEWEENMRRREAQEALARAEAPALAGASAGPPVPTMLAIARLREQLRGQELGRLFPDLAGRRGAGGGPLEFSALPQPAPYEFTPRAELAPGFVGPTRPETIARLVREERARERRYRESDEMNRTGAPAGVWRAPRTLAGDIKEVTGAITGLAAGAKRAVLNRVDLIGRAFGGGPAEAKAAAAQLAAGGGMAGRLLAVAGDQFNRAARGEGERKQFASEIYGSPEEYASRLIQASLEGGQDTQKQLLDVQKDAQKALEKAGTALNKIVTEGIKLLGGIRPQ